MAADEKRFEAGGSEWIARFDFNAICELEERYDRPFLELVAPFLGSVSADDSNEARIAAASRIKFSDLRAIFHQCLLSAQPDTTAKGAGDLIGEVGLPAVMEVVTWAIMKAMPKGDEGNAEAAPKRRKG
jgi:hypothetical protein